MNGERESMQAYDAFAGIYDSLMDDIDYDGWADYYLRLLNDLGVQPRALCDCACGTGSMSVRFAARGIRVTGVDISGEMLSVAQEKARRFGVQAMFVRQDMCDLRLPRRVDALVCACDGVNYLLDDARLKRFFASAREALKPGGALAFDISSAHKLRDTLGNAFFGEERDDIAYLWSNRFDDQSETVTMDLTFFVRQKDELFRRFSEIHVQKAHDPDHLSQLLRDSGFRDVRVFGDRTFEVPGPDAPRIHVAAIRE